MDNEYTVIGKPRPIGDAALKVTGQKIYVGDMELPGMLYAKVLLSTVPHARIKSIDTSAAEALPGVKAVATYKNTPQVGTTARSVLLSTSFRTRNVSLTTPCALWETGWLPWRRSPRT